MPELWRYENRPDWKQIVESTPCPEYGCGAQAGQPCRNVGSIPGTIRAQQPRADWHMARKFMAVNSHELKQAQQITEQFQKEESHARQI